MASGKSAFPATSRLDSFNTLAICAIAVLGAIVAWVAPVDGDDSSFHLHWIPAFYDILRSGVMIPKWVPDGFHGFGAPTFFFYPPLTYYITSLLQWITGASPDAIFNQAAFVSTLGSGIACYYLLRKLESSPRNAILGSLFFAFAPFRQFDLYTRSSISQPMGFVFVPLLVAGLHEILTRQRKDWRPNLLLAGSWAGIMLCAFPLGVATGLMTMLAAIAFRTRLNTNRVIAAVLSFLLGSLLVAYHYLPAMYLQKYVQTEYYSASHLHGNWLPALLHASQLRFVAMDLLLWITYSAIFVWSVKMWRANRHDATLGAIIILCAFWIVVECPYLSDPIWTYLYPFQLIRYHERFGIFIVLFVSVLAFAPIAAERSRQLMSIAVAIWCLVAIGLSCSIIFNIHPHSHGTSAWMDSPEYLPIATMPAALAMDSLFLPHRNDPFVHCEPPLDSRELVSSVRRTSRLSSFNCSFDKPHRLTLHQFLWPGWIGATNDQSVALHRDSIDRVIMDIPAGAHEVNLRLQQLPIEKAGNWCSAFGVVIFVLLSIRSILRNTNSA